MLLSNNETNQAHVMRSLLIFVNVFNDHFQDQSLYKASFSAGVVGWQNVKRRSDDSLYCIYGWMLKMHISIISDMICLMNLLLCTIFSFFHFCCYFVIQYAII